MFKIFRIKDEAGFTLVEIMIAFVLLVIMSGALITMFTTGYSGIFRAGSKSEALFEAQENIDNAIADGTDSESVIVTRQILFGSEPIDVSYEIKKIDYQNEGISGTLYYYFPSGN